VTETENYETVQEHRHQAQAHAAELSQAVGDPLKAVRKALKAGGADIRTATVEISYMLRGSRPFSQEEQVANLEAVLEKINALEVPSAEALKAKAQAALEAALAELDTLVATETEGAQAHLDGLRDSVTKGLRLAQTRDFNLHQQRKQALANSSAWWANDQATAPGNGSGLEDGPLVTDEDGDVHINQYDADTIAALKADEGPVQDQ
jgi:hypothetical protein